MKTLEIYKNYGVLESEKRNVFTFGAEHSTATCSDKITVAIPDGWNVFETASGRTAVTAPWGWDYDIDDVLQGNKKPYFCAMDHNMNEHRAELEEITQN